MIKAIVMDASFCQIKTCLAASVLFMVGACAPTPSPFIPPAADSEDAADASHRVSRPDLPVTDLSAGDLVLSVEMGAQGSNPLIAQVQVTASAPTSVRVRFQCDDSPIRETPGTEIGTKHPVTVVGLRSESSCSFTAVADVDGVEVVSAPVALTTGPIPFELPPLEVISSRIDEVDGFTLFGLLPNAETEEGSSSFLGVDEAGKVVWYFDQGSSDPLDIQPQPDGTLLVVSGDHVQHITVTGEVLGDLVGQDVLPEGRFHHDATMMPSGTVLTLTTEKRVLDVPSIGADQLVRGDRLVEFNWEGQEVWSWSTFDHLDTDRYPTGLSQQGCANAVKGCDWTHANGLVYLADEDAILLSLRHQHWVLKIDRVTGEVLWRLGPEGDFSLEDGGEWFYGQHSPEWHEDGTLMLFDNGSNKPVLNAYSRAVSYAIDSVALTATEVWSAVTDEATGRYGDADRLANGHVLISPWLPDRIMQLAGDGTGDRVWELVTGGSSYRATRLPSFWWATATP